MNDSEEKKVRELLWQTHPCSGKYGDDGELQCSSYLPPIDFQRDTWIEIVNKSNNHFLQRRTGERDE